MCLHFFVSFFSLFLHSKQKKIRCFYWNGSFKPIHYAPIFFPSIFGYCIDISLLWDINMLINPQEKKKQWEYAPAVAIQNQRGVFLLLAASVILRRELVRAFVLLVKLQHINSFIGLLLEKTFGHFYKEALCFFRQGFPSNQGFTSIPIYRSPL